MLFCKNSLFLETSRQSSIYLEYIKNWQSGWWSLLRMFIAINKEGHQTIEAVVKITMNGGIIGYNRLMLVCQAEYFRQLLKPVT